MYMYVCIYYSSLHRVLEPSVLMEMKLSDGTIKTFEVCVYCFTVIVRLSIVKHSVRLGIQFHVMIHRSRELSF